MFKQFCINGHDTAICGRTIRSRCKLCRKAEDKITQHTPKEKMRQRNKWLRTQYGIDLSEYNRLFQIQGGMCAVCKIHQSQLNKSLCVDHNHQTGKVRGLLCPTCNSQVIVAVEYYRHLIETAKVYLEEKI